MQHKTLLTLLASLSILVVAPLRAQSDSSREDIDLTQPLNMETCINYALKHSPTLQRAKLQSQLLDMGQRDAKYRFTPNISASIGQSASFGRSQDKTGIYIDHSSANTSFQVGAGISLFEGGDRWYALKQAKIDQDAKGYVIKSSEDRLKLNIIRLYIDVLVQKDIHEVAKEKLNLTKKNMYEVQERVRVGKLSKSRLVEMKAQESNDIMAVAETQANLKRAKILLKLDMGLAPNDSIQIAYPSELEKQKDPTADKLLMPQTGYKTPDLHLAELEVEKATYDIKRAKAAYWPSLTMSVGYNNSYYYNFDKDLKAFNKSFTDQLKDNGRSYIGLNLSIPIFNQGRNSGNLKRARIKELQLKNELNEKIIEENKNRELAQLDLYKAKEQKDLAETNLKLSEESLTYASAEFESGRMSSYEYELAKNKLAEAKAKLIRASFNEIEKAILLYYYYFGKIDYSLVP